MFLYFTRKRMEFHYHVTHCSLCLIEREENNDSNFNERRLKVARLYLVW